ncbi:MAG: hypothetical protein ACXW1W_14015, partial [Methylococcaceae bacterium]
VLLFQQRLLFSDVLNESGDAVGVVLFFRYKGLIHDLKAIDISCVVVECALSKQPFNNEANLQRQRYQAAQSQIAKRFTGILAMLSSILTNAD